MSGRRGVTSRLINSCINSLLASGNNVLSLSLRVGDAFYSRLVALLLHVPALLDATNPGLTFLANRCSVSMVPVRRPRSHDPWDDLNAGGEHGRSLRGNAMHRRQTDC